jgi:hypothetical protein
LGIHEIEPSTIPTAGLKVEQRYMLARGTDARPVLWVQLQGLPNSARLPIQKTARF